MSRILYIVNDSAFFVSHRLPLAVAAKEQGHDVYVASGGVEKIGTIEAAGLIHIPIPLSRKGMNPLLELKLLLHLAKVIMYLKPDLVHLVTIKPVLYGGILSRLLRVPAVVAAISGMGYLFTDKRRSVGRLLAELMYRFSLGHENCCVIVQNNTDLDSIVNMAHIPRSKCRLIPGSGVNLNKYASTKNAHISDSPLVIFPARLLRDKGVYEFVEAAKIIKSLGCVARFVIVGSIDTHNPTSIEQIEIDKWINEGVVEHWGYREDMEAVFAQCSVVVLPSYREGMPKSLLEACAASKPIVTTDVPGCRDVVSHGVNGFLVPPRDCKQLADGIITLLNDPLLRNKMGDAGRVRAINEFGIERVIADHCHIYSELFRVRNKD